MCDKLRIIGFVSNRKREEKKSGEEDIIRRVYDIIYFRYLTERIQRLMRELRTASALSASLS